MRPHLEQRPGGDPGQEHCQDPREGMDRGAQQHRSQPSPRHLQGHGDPAGDRRSVVDVQGRSVSTGICMDLNDNQFALHLLTARPDIVAFPTNWVDEGHDILPYWRWRMMGWRGWFVAADRWGEEKGTRFYGRSAILAPGGVPVAMAGPSGDTVIVADITT